MTCTASTAVALWTFHCLGGLIIHLPNTLQQGTGVLLLVLTAAICFVVHTLSLSFIHIFIFASGSSSSSPSLLLPVETASSLCLTSFHPLPC